METSPWLVKPDNPAMNRHAPGKTSTRHTDKQWKVEKRGGRGKTTERPTQNALVPTTSYHPYK